MQPFPEHTVKMDKQPTELYSIRNYLSSFVSVVLNHLLCITYYYLRLFNSGGFIEQTGKGTICAESDRASAYRRRQDSSFQLAVCKTPQGHICPEDRGY